MGFRELYSSDPAKPLEKPFFALQSPIVKVTIVVILPRHLMYEEDDLIKKGPVPCFQDTGRNTGNDLLSHNL